jgi:CRISPR/Cas system-associated exonuclease Cas4 (RecB family)
MIFPYEPHVVEQAGAHFDDVVKCILNRRFEVIKPPERKVCKECDLRVYCLNEKVFRNYPDHEE